MYSQRNRSAACRIPLYSQSPKAKRVEFRCPDPSCNPYLAFSAMLMAGLDGVQNRIEPPDPVDKDLYDLPPEELSKVPQVPGSLDEALAALEADHDFLKAGGVFTDDLLETWIEYKRAERGRRHPPAPAPVGVHALLRHLERGPTNRGASCSPVTCCDAVPYGCSDCKEAIAASGATHWDLLIDRVSAGRSPTGDLSRLASAR